MPSDEMMEDMMREFAVATTRIRDAICPCHSGTDESGTYVESLTEAVMGVTASLEHVASALNNIAEAIREHKN